MYMRGVRKEELVALMDFLYNGEANVIQDTFESFLVLAEELRLTGLKWTEKVGKTTNISPIKEIPETKKDHNYLFQNQKEENYLFSNLDNIQSEVIGTQVVVAVEGGEREVRRGNHKPPGASSLFFSDLIGKIFTLSHRCQIILFSDHFS